ncbi:hypothetical protein [Levilactobacillus fuyuanensis]|uniref:Uncharacterized protein n=1 Tax=Levilactobacillus fuyuanensis TaxID=2486022 RepID=A0ABW4H178_9LACO|nr:hypothetical protein [Levilactobacillus fuyuanensis]
MEPAVTMVLVRALYPGLTAWDDLEDTRLLCGFKASWKPVLWLEAVPTAGGILAAAGDCDTTIFNLSAEKKQFLGVGTARGCFSEVLLVSR